MRSPSTVVFASLQLQKLQSVQSVATDGMMATGSADRRITHRGSAQHDEVHHVTMMTDRDLARQQGPGPHAGKGPARQQYLIQDDKRGTSGGKLDTVLEQTDRQTDRTGRGTRAKMGDAIIAQRGNETGGAASRPPCKIINHCSVAINEQRPSVCTECVEPPKHKNTVSFFVSVHTHTAQLLRTRLR